MNAEIISVGTELLLGDILNTNTQYLSRELARLGVNVYHHQSVGDNRDRLKEALQLSLERSDVVITVAGLGPTEDDITCETVCNTLGVPMVYNPGIEEEIRRYFEMRRKAMPESNIKQAVVPDGAIILHNKIGTAPGSIVSAGEKCVIMLPGPPAELKSMFESMEVQNKLKEYSNGTILSQTIHVIGMSESEVAEKIADLVKYDNPTVATYAKNGEVEIRITSSGVGSTAINWLINPIIEKIVQRLGYKIYGFGETDLQTELVNKLMENNIKIATAESCTAGSLSKIITDVPGASSIFEMGVTTYSGDKKTKLLGVSKKTLDTYGEVSPETSREMAVGILLKSGSDIGVGITGIAGPDGGTPQKPVGLVYISIADRNYVYTGMLKLGNRGREFIREVSVKSALDMVRRCVSGFEMTLGRPVATSIIESNLEGMKAVEEPKPTEAFIHGFDISSNREDLNFEPDPVAQPAIIPKNVAPSMYPPVPAAEPQKHVTPAESYRAFVQGEDFNSDKNEKSGDESIKNKFKNAFAKKKSDNGEKSDIKTEEKAKSEAPKEEKKKDTRPWYKKLLFWFIPEKGDDTISIVIKIFRAICIIALIVCAVLISAYYLDLYNKNRVADKTKGLYVQSNDVGSNGILESLQGLYNLNSDLVGYLTIDGQTPDGKNLDLTGPIVKSEDNDYYLSHDFYKNSNRFGARFADAANVFGTDGTLSQNTIIYGHYTDDGEIFGGLYHFKELDFYKQHSVIEFDTLYEKTYWKVFSVFITNTHAEHDNGYIFPYRTLEFADQNAFMSFTTELQHRSIITTNVDVVEGDKILTLSTCSRVFKDARFVVVARQVREGEDPSVDLSQTALNPIPLYPDIWYTDVDRNAVKPVFDNAGVQVTTAPTTATTQTTQPTSETTTAPPSTVIQPPATHATTKAVPKTTAKPTTKATTKEPTQTTTKAAIQFTTRGQTTTGV